MAEKGLSARESLAQTLEVMRQKLSGREINLPSTPKAEIANDSDWHRTKTGFSAYEKVMLVTIRGKEWIIAFGIACGDYPADKYDCDLAAIPIASDGKPDEQLVKEIGEALEANRYFKNSVFIVTDDGRIALNPDGPFRQELLKALGAGVPKEFTAQQPEFQEGVLTGDCRPVVKSAKRYTKNFPGYLSDRACETLAACS